MKINALADDFSHTRVDADFSNNDVDLSFFFSPTILPQDVELF